MKNSFKLGKMERSCAHAWNIKNREVRKAIIQNLMIWGNLFICTIVRNSLKYMLSFKGKKLKNSRGWTTYLIVILILIIQSVFLLPVFIPVRLVVTVIKYSWLGRLGYRTQYIILDTSKMRKTWKLIIYINISTTSR